MHTRQIFPASAHIRGSSKHQGRTSMRWLPNLLPMRFAALRYRSQQARMSSSMADSPSSRAAYTPAEPPCHISKQFCTACQLRAYSVPTEGSARGLKGCQRCCAQMQRSCHWVLQSCHADKVQVRACTDLVPFELLENGERWGAPASLFAAMTHRPRASGDRAAVAALSASKHIALMPEMVPSVAFGPCEACAAVS